MNPSSLTAGASKVAAKSTNRAMPTIRAGERNRSAAAVRRASARSGARGRETPATPLQPSDRLGRPRARRSCLSGNEDDCRRDKQEIPHREKPNLTVVLGEQTAVAIREEDVSGHHRSREEPCREPGAREHDATPE